MKKLRILSAIVVLIFTSSMIAQNQTQTPTVDVTGEGIVRVVPDEVTINIRVENTGESTQYLKQQNDAIINEVLKFLKKMGIADKDVKTEYITLNKNYDYNTKTYTFAANQSLSVKLRDLKKYEELMKGLLDSGINRIDGVQFSSSNNEALESQARKKAVENAQMKAKEYATVLGQSIGKAVSISEYKNVSGPQPMYKMAMSDSSGGDSQSISLGEMEIRTTVNVSFLLN
ncbi:SIMPL domain-containing protein [Aequorivita echinoideorum]|uniref:SIMPL domain-containing protein n=1 Tax=Aequorivita echinoideorum TaxID=1549647 RepID=A0ABS5SBB7_9FLAO|nr:SIMPL domain-containing protein [Aequorivita echinoideorum]MBT0609160.1 SIMPL domain-containing protein [Aequorivita echinoideorum]